MLRRESLLHRMAGMGYCIVVLTDLESPELVPEPTTMPCLQLQAALLAEQAAETQPFFPRENAWQRRNQNLPWYHRFERRNKNT